MENPNGESRVGRPVGRWLVGFVALATIALSLASCGGGGDSTGSTSNGETATAAATTTGGKGSVCDVGKRSIGYNDFYAVGGIQGHFSGAVEYATKALGWEFKLLNGKANPAQALKNQETFGNEGVDAIITSSVPSEWVRPAQASLEEKGIPSVNIVVKASPGVYNADVNEQATATTSALANQLIREYPNGGKVGIIEDQAVPLETERVELLEELLQQAGNFEIVSVHENPADNQPAAAKATVDMMNANPEIEIIVAISSSLAQYTLQGLREVNQPNVNVYTWYVTSENAELFNGNPNFIGVTDSDSARIPFVALTELMKSFCGGTMKEQQYVPVKGAFYTREVLAKLPPAHLKHNEGPQSYQEVAKPFFEEWKKMYGIGPGTAPPNI